MAEKDVKLIMVTAASSAIDFLKKKSNAETEEVMRHVMKSIKARGNAKLAGIAAASHVIKLKERNPKITQKQAMQNLADSSQDILNSINNQDEAQEMPRV